MFQAILMQYDEVHDILSARKELRYLYAMDKDLLASVVSLLEHFKTASEKACADSHPTLHLVVPMYHKLITTACTADNSDNEVIRELKEKGSRALRSQVWLDALHDVAAF